MSSDEFDATQINPASLKFGVGEAAPASTPFTNANIDGLFGPDFTVRYQVSESGIACNDTEVTLIGETYSGEAFTGTDAINATQCEAGCHEYP